MFGASMTDPFLNEWPLSAGRALFFASSTYAAANCFFSRIARAPPEHLVDEAFSEFGRRPMPIRKRHRSRSRFLMAARRVSPP